MNGTKTSRKRAATGRITLPPARMSASESALAMALRKVDMKGAVKAAIACVEGFFPEAKDILLEEVELRQGHYENDASEGRSIVACGRFLQVGKTGEIIRGHGWRSPSLQGSLH